MSGCGVGQSTLNALEMADLEECYSFLRSFALSDRPDVWRWLPDESGIFSIASVKRLAGNVDITADNNAWKWKGGWIPLKVKIFIWRSSLDRIPTRTALAKRNIHLDLVVCPLCGEVPESVDHIFTACEVSASLWLRLSVWAKTPPIYAFDFKDLLSCHKGLGLGKKARDIVRGLIVVACWCLWKARNEIVFSNGREISHLTNLEKLDLSLNNLNATPSIQACKSLMRLKRLESIYLGTNYFNKSIISCLGFLPSLKILDLSRSVELRGSFPMQELSSLRELNTLDMSYCYLESLKLNGTMRNLLHLNLDMNYFNDHDIMRSMAAFPSLEFLSLDGSFIKGRTLFANDFPNFPYLKVLILSYNDFNGTLPMEAFTSFPRLEVLDLSYNNFFGSIPSTINSLSSINAISFASNNLNGLSGDAFCELKNLLELDLRHNQFAGNLPECFMSLSSLKLFDISKNQFTGKLPYLLTNLTSLEYIDFSHNKFEGSFSFSSFSNHTKLEVVAFVSDNNKFEVETEEPTGWTPMFQLKVLVLSNCNINKPKGNIVPSFLLHQHKLSKLDMSHNSLEGKFPNWLINNNSELEVLILRDNSFGGTFCMSFNRNPNVWWLDMSRNHMTGAIPTDIKKFLPGIAHLNMSMNFLDGTIPSTIGDLGELQILDLSNNDFFGEVPTEIFSNLSKLAILKLSNNSLHGEVLSRDLKLENIKRLQLDSNHFTGKMTNQMSELSKLSLLDISNNFFTGLIPDWITNSTLSDFVVRNNRFGGRFPCGTTSFSFLDISQNYFSGPIPSCLNFQNTRHLHLGSNRFTGSIPGSFRDLIEVLTLDIGNNHLSGMIPEFLGELSTLRILLLNKNKFRRSSCAN
ncbi:putative non-specific serine/threonine protein kinase [Helianthus annuus]|nr:putative non-specific serine/threonine protein kinase [Helianthus annuus]